MAIHRKREERAANSGKEERIREKEQEMEQIMTDIKEKKDQTKNYVCNSAPNLMHEWISVKTVNQYNLNLLEDLGVCGLISCNQNCYRQDNFEHTIKSEKSTSSHQAWRWCIL